MTRRTTTVIVGLVPLVALVVVALAVPMPYVVMSPGPTANALGQYKGKPVISIDGHRTYPTSGHLNMTTVSVTKPGAHPRLTRVLRAWFAEDQVVLPRDVVYPPGQTVQEVKKENKAQMLGSQQTAVVAALAEVGIDAVHVTIRSVVDGAPADGKLRKGDEIVAVNGKQTEDATAVVEAVSGLKPGSEVTFTIIRDGHKRHVSMTTEPSPEDSSRSRIGAVLQDNFNPPFEVQFDKEIVQNIGGPSAGTMFALATYDMLTPGKLTGGRFIAGTGTINAEGQVGPIGGVQQKIAGAYAAGARYFLVPAGDCATAAKSHLADNIMLIKMTNLDGAIAALKKLGHDNAAIPRCG